MGKLLTKEKAGWFGTPDDTMAFKIDESLVTLAVKPLCSDKYEMVSVPKEVILELAERIKPKSVDKKKIQQDFLNEIMEQISDMPEVRQRLKPILEDFN